MYEYARRLMSSSHHAESAKLLLTEASETYLAAINSLHLSGPDSAWVTISSTGYGPDEVSMKFCDEKQLWSSASGKGVQD